MFWFISFSWIFWQKVQVFRPNLIDKSFEMLSVKIWTLASLFLNIASRGIEFLQEITTNLAKNGLKNNIWPLFCVKFHFQIFERVMKSDLRHWSLFLRCNLDFLSLLNFSFCLNTVYLWLRFKFQTYIYRVRVLVYRVFYWSKVQLIRLFVQESAFFKSNFPTFHFFNRYSILGLNLLFFRKAVDTFFSANRNNEVLQIFVQELLVLKRWEIVVLIIESSLL